MRILLVEDEPTLRAQLRVGLVEAGYAVDEADNGRDAHFIGDTESFDAVILDLGLPVLDGLTVLKRWRDAGRSMPVLILTARGSWKERVEGIDAGADDYLPKPFRMEELLARARALVRRIGGQAASQQSVGELAIDLNRMSITLQGVPVNVTPLEFRLISYLALHRDRVISPTELLDHLYGDEDSRDTNALEAVIVRVRRKLGPGVIGTRRGFGYFLEGMV